MKQDNYILLKGPAVKPHFKQKKKCHKQLRSIVFPLHSQKGDDKFFMTNLPDEVQGNFVQIKMSKCQSFQQIWEANEGVKELFP